MTKFYVDERGFYLGGFDGVEPPEGAMEVPEPPTHGAAQLVNGVWVLPKDAINANIIAQLDRIDAKSIRALREGDQVRIDALEAEAAALRLQLIK